MPKPFKGDRRTEAQLREHFAIERELAATLRSASRQERLGLYSSLYDQLYRRVQNHPQLTRASSLALTARAVERQMRLIGPFLTRQRVFLELGPGDCALASHVSTLVDQVYAVDVSAELSRSSPHPANFQLVLSDGCTVPVPTGSVDVAYSNQLMEHLHPDDAVEQLANIYSALTTGGVYVCVTPNRLSGPHDVSRGFDPVATGLHLKEYTVEELQRLFRGAGFSRIGVCVGARGRYLKLPAVPVVLLEKLLWAMPPAAGSRIARSFPFRQLLGIRLVAVK